MQNLFNGIKKIMKKVSPTIHVKIKKGMNETVL